MKGLVVDWQGLRWSEDGVILWCVCRVWDLSLAMCDLVEVKSSVPAHTDTTLWLCLASPQRHRNTL